MILMPTKYVLIACLFGLVPLADRAHADPVNVPGMERVLSGGKAGDISGVNDLFGCPGLGTSIWIVLVSPEDRNQIGKELDDHFGRPSEDGETYNAFGPTEQFGEIYSGSWSPGYGDLVVDHITKVHQRVSKIDSRQHPDAVLRLHAVQHLAEECVLANGEVPPYQGEDGAWYVYDGMGHYSTRAASCVGGFDATRAVMLDCAEKAIDTINARHDWNVTFQRNE